MRERYRKNIIIAAVPFSPNLGDGIIHEALEFSISSHKQNVILHTLDIAGRLDYGANYSNIKSSTSSLKYFVAIPKFIRIIIVLCYVQYLYYKRLKPVYHNKLSISSIMIIGGGQLFSDVDLNFPIKLYFLLKQARKTNTSIIIYGAGISSNISRIGEWLFAKLLNSNLIKNVYLRDDVSIQNYFKYRFINKRIQEVWDPGILISRKYPKIFDKKKKYIGIGVSSPMNLKYSGDSFVEINYDSVLLKIITHLISLNKNILLFTNGTIEDEEYKERLYTKISSDEKRNICLASRPNRPLDLVNIITETEYIISQRLHANIIAYSYKIPSIGIVWDKKLVGFFKKIKREGMLLDLNNQDWFSMFAKLLTDSLIHINIDDHTQFLNEADFQIKEMMIKNDITK